MTLFSSFFVALMVSMVLVPPLLRYSGRLGLVDVPDDRKLHGEAIPRSGGIAIVLGAIVSLLVWWPGDPQVLALMAGALVIVVFGVFDDRFTLHYGWKFFGQFLAVGLVMYAGILIEVLPFAGIDAAPAYLTIPLTAAFLVGVTNAINLSDGLDGLAAGTALLALAAIAWLFYRSGASGLAVVSLAVLGGICGFLRYNNHPAVIFMGDGGSQFLGFMSACLAILLTQRPTAPMSPALPLLLLGLPILDTLTVMTWRIRNGRSPFLPDRNHFHHRLLNFGFHHYEAVSIIYLAQAALVLLAVLFWRQSDALVFGTYVAFALLVLAGFRIGRVKNFRAHPQEQGASGPERRNQWLRRFPELPNYAAGVTEILASLFLLFSVFYPVEVKGSFGWTCLGFAAIVVAARFVPVAQREIAMRVAIYMAGVCAVYALIGDGRFPNITDWYINAYMMLLATFLMLAIRLTRREEFRTTPLDLLILLFILTVVVLTGVYGGSQHGLADAAIRVAVFFYASEFLATSSRRHSLALSIVAAVALAGLAARGIGGF